MGTGERTREQSGGNAWYLDVLSGFATTDLSVRFCDTRQGGEAYGKTVCRGLFFALLQVLSRVIP